MSSGQSPRVSFLDSNGLEAGNIPAGKPCPFYGHCGSADERCPRDGATKPRPYSCAAARAHSIVARLSTSRAP